MDKILILTCSTGEGHNSAARAVETALKNRGAECLIRDPVSFQSQRMTRLVSNLYNGTIRRTPRLFGAVYKLGDLYSSSKLPSPIYWANSKYAKNLKEYILENGFTAVVCTHLYGMEAMTAIRKDPEFTVPCYGVLTDYVTIPFLHDIHLTRLFVPMEEIKNQLVEQGLQPDQVVVSGIPVNASFTCHPSKREARELLHLPQDKNIYLLMLGGVGADSMEKLCSRILSTMEQQDMLIVFTGRNQPLRERLQEKYGDAVTALGFTDQVSLYLAAGDVLLSKPGGLSSTEAAVANIPLVHIRGIPGCETYNARYFEENGMACHAGNDEQAADFARTLAHDRKAAEKMCLMQRTHVNANAARQIAEEVMGA